MQLNTGQKWCVKRLRSVEYTIVRYSTLKRWCHTSASNLCNDLVEWHHGQAPDTSTRARDCCWTCRCTSAIVCRNDLDFQWPSRAAYTDPTSHCGIDQGCRPTVVHNKVITTMVIWPLNDPVGHSAGRRSGRRCRADFTRSFGSIRHGPLNRWRSQKMSIEHIGWLWCKVMPWTIYATAFAKASNEWVQIEHNMYGRWVAWSPLWWWACLFFTFEMWLGWRWSTCFSWFWNW